MGSGILLLPKLFDQLSEKTFPLMIKVLSYLLFPVGGVMAFLTLHEMLPLAFDYAGQKQAVKAVFFGMAFMSAR